MHVFSKITGLCDPDEDIQYFAESVLLKAYLLLTCPHVCLSLRPVLQQSHKGRVHEH